MLVRQIHGVREVDVGFESVAGGSWPKAKPMEVPSIEENLGKVADQFGSNLSCKLVFLCSLCPPKGDKDRIVDRSKKLSCASIAFPCARR